MKKSRWYLCITLFLMLLGTGCMDINSTLVTDSDPMRPSFEIYGKKIFQRVNGLGVKYIYFYYYEYDEDENKSVRSGKIINSWEVMATEQSSKIRKITYGEAPEGYIDLMKPQPLRINQKYYMEFSYGDIVLRVSFKIINKDGKLVVETVQ